MVYAEGRAPEMTKFFFLSEYLNFSMGSVELKLISLETARHFRIFFGTRASCSNSGTDRSSLPCQRIFPVSASRRFIQLTENPLRMSSEREGMLDEVG